MTAKYWRCLIAVLCVFTLTTVFAGTTGVAAVCAETAAVPPAPEKSAVVTAAVGLNVRSGPGIAHAVLTTANPGAVLPVSGAEGDWVRVKLTSGKQGWVARQYVRVESGSAPAAPQTDPAPSPPAQIEKTAVVTAAAVKLRSGPGTSHAEVTLVREGARFPILETAGHWVKVRRSPGQEAWVAGWLIRVEGSPVAPPAAAQNESPGAPETGGNPDGGFAGEQALPPGAMVVVKVESVDIKNKPQTGAPTIACATMNSKLPAAARSGAWYKVEFAPGSAGWMSKDEVTLHEEESPSRGTDAEKGDGAKPGPWTIKVVEAGDRTALRIEASSPMAVETLTLSGPDRLVVDLTGVAVDALPADLTVRSEAVETVRIGRQTADVPTARVVCDLVADLGLTRYQTELSADERTLAVDIWTVDDEWEDRVIALDPGHGGGDPGAIGPTGLMEKDFNLAVALEAARLLRAEGARVVLTRDTDVRLGATAAADCQARSRIANEHRADLFVSIHANSNLSRTPAGTNVYYHAHPENHNHCVKLARALQASLVRELGRQDRGIVGSNLMVLRGIDMPGALVETAFISNNEEEALLRQPAFQKRAAAGIVAGIKTYFRS